MFECHSLSGCYDPVKQRLYDESMNAIHTIFSTKIYRKNGRNHDLSREFFFFSQSKSHISGMGFSYSVRCMLDYNMHTLK